MVHTPAGAAGVAGAWFIRTGRLLYSYGDLYNSGVPFKTESAVTLHDNVLTAVFITNIPQSKKYVKNTFIAHNSYLTTTISELSSDGCRVANSKSWFNAKRTFI